VPERGGAVRRRTAAGGGPCARAAGVAGNAANRAGGDTAAGAVARDAGGIAAAGVSGAQAGAVAVRAQENGDRHLEDSEPVPILLGPRSHALAPSSFSRRLAWPADCQAARHFAK